MAGNAPIAHCLIAMVASHEFAWTRLFRTQLSEQDAAFRIAQ
jgi:hypothetical protein